MGANLISEATVANVRVSVDPSTKTITILPPEDAQWTLVLGTPSLRIKDIIGRQSGVWLKTRVDDIDKTQWRE